MNIENCNIRIIAAATILAVLIALLAVPGVMQAQGQGGAAAPPPAPFLPGQTAGQYYKNVVDTNGGEKKTSDSVRLFLAPGMGHCGGGEGPNKMDLEGTLDRWVEISLAAI